jgi:hypothetical protein
MKFLNSFKGSIIMMFAVSLSLFALTSCNKYEDGPGISLRTRTERVSNTWKVENYKVNGSDFTSLLNDYRETFTKSGNYSYTWNSLNGTGTWVFQNKDQEIRLTGNDNQSSRTFIILKLEEKSFWYYYMDGNDKHEIHLIPG